MQLSIPVRRSGIDAAKLALTRAIPDVKSSHRCEALARGLGFRTYASLLAAGREDEPLVATVDWQSWAAYLSDHGFEARGAVLFRAVAKAALHLVAEQVPTLTSHGFGIGERMRRADGQWETPEDRRESFKRGRESLLNFDEAFLACLDFLSRVDRTKTVRSNNHSYWLKHIVENYTSEFPSGEKLGPVYVPNGTLIAAAIHAGFVARPCSDHPDQLNAYFNMGRSSLLKLDAQIRPDGPNGWRLRNRRGGY